MCKSWAKVVCTQRKVSGSFVHNDHAELWMNQVAAHLSPTLSPLPTTLCTQIVHKPVDKITGVMRHFSAKSTGPITTTTTYINI